MRVRVLVHRRHREVGRDVAGRQRAERQRDEQRIASARSNWRAASARRRACARRSTGATAWIRAERQRQHQRVMAEFRDHRTCRSRVLRFAFLPAPGLLQRIDHLARHIALVMLGEHGVGRQIRRRRRACLPPPRPALRGTGPARCPDSAPQCRSCRRSPRNGCCRLSPRLRLPCLTSPPMRMRVPGADDASRRCRSAN